MAADGFRTISDSRRILLVEDHADTLRLMERMLRLWGHSVYPARTINEALVLSGQQPFDVLIADIQLPDGSGLDLIARLKQQRDAFHAIAVSGHAFPEHIQASQRAGFDHHVSKPFDLEKLRRLLILDGKAK